MKSALSSGVVTLSLVLSLQAHAAAPSGALAAVMTEAVPTESESDMIQGFGSASEDFSSEAIDPSELSAEPADVGPGDRVQITVKLGPAYEGTDCRLFVTLNGAPYDRVGGADGVMCRQAARMESELHPGPVPPTPTGTYPAIRLSKSGNPHMPNAVYFRPYYAIHAGKMDRGSHGCVRVRYADSVSIFDLVQRVGRGNTTITLER